MMYVEFNNGDCELLTTLRKRVIWHEVCKVAYHGIVVNDTHIVAAFESKEEADNVWAMWKELMANATLCGLQQEAFMFPDRKTSDMQRYRCAELADNGEIIE